MLDMFIYRYIWVYCVWNSAWNDSRFDWLETETVQLFFICI